MKEFALVYQAGIANVFRFIGGDKKELVYQGDFRTAESLVRGAKLAGAFVGVFACNRAGNIKDAEWTVNLDNQPFSEKFSCKDLV
jgi:hypothetical protein